MDAKELVARLKPKIIETKEALQEGMSLGACDDYATYREFVGSITALESVLEFLKEVQKDALDDDANEDKDW